MILFGLLVGALFTKKGQYGSFWDAVYAGVKESVPILVLLFVIGMFSTLIKACNVSAGFVWLADLLHVGGGLFTAFTFLACCIISTATGFFHRQHVYLLPDFLPRRCADGLQPGYACRGHRMRFRVRR